MPKLKKVLYAIALSFVMLRTFAQPMDHASEEPTDFMNANGKIYVVMTVVVIIVLGLFLYLINLDRKIKRLEQESNQRRK